MASQNLQQTSQTSRFSVGYAVVWGLLSAVAIGYLAMLAARPDIASRLILRPAEGTPESNFSQRSMSKALAELEAAKAAIARLEAEAKQVKAVLAAVEQRGLAMDARMGALETIQKSQVAAASDKATPIADKVTAAPKAEPERVSSAALSGQNTQGTIEERPAKALREGRPPRVAAAAVAGKPVETASFATSVATSAPVSGPANVPANVPSGPPVGVLIATGPSLDAVRLSWQLLTETNKSVLRPFEPRYVESIGDGGLFQLIAGPVASREEAARVCERLKARNARCSVTGFTGQPL